MRHLQSLHVHCPITWQIYNIGRDWVFWKNYLYLSKIFISFELYLLLKSRRSIGRGLQIEQITTEIIQQIYCYCYESLTLLSFLPHLKHYLSIKYTYYIIHTLFDIIFKQPCHNNKHATYKVSISSGISQLKNNYYILSLVRMKYLCINCLCMNTEYWSISAKYSCFLTTG